MALRRQKSLNMVFAASVYFTLLGFVWPKRICAARIYLFFAHLKYWIFIVFGVASKEETVQCFNCCTQTNGYMCWSIALLTAYILHVGFILKMHGRHISRVEMQVKNKESIKKTPKICSTKCKQMKGGETSGATWYTTTTFTIVLWPWYMLPYPCCIHANEIELQQPIKTIAALHFWHCSTV